MSRFTERLWRDLVREHGADLAQVSRPAGHGRRARPRLLAGTTAGLAGVGSAVALVLGAAGTSPAFAVSKNDDGTVSVVVTQFAAMRDANARLAKLGVRAQFVQVAAGCAAPPPAIKAALLARQVRIGAVQVKNGSLHARFDPKLIPPGRTLMMRAWRDGREIKVSAARVVRGAVPPCVARAVSTSVHGAIVKRPAGGVVRCVFVRPLPAGSGISTGSSGNVKSGPPPAGNSGPPVTADSGNSGSSGKSGSPAAGQSAVPRRQVLPCPAWSHATARAASIARAAAAADARRAKTGEH